MMRSLFPRCRSQLTLIAPTQDALPTFIVLEFVLTKMKTPN
jgi:hypothetical protein